MILTGSAKLAVNVKRFMCLNTFFIIHSTTPYKNLRFSTVYCSSGIYNRSHLYIDEAFTLKISMYSLSFYTITYIQNSIFRYCIDMNENNSRWKLLMLSVKYILLYTCIIYFATVLPLLLGRHIAYLSKVLSLLR